MREVTDNIAAALPAASAVFAARGLDGTRMDDIVEATGIPRPTLYYHFSSKEEILAWLLERLLRDLSVEIGHILDRDELARDRLHAVFGAYLGLFAKHRELCTVLLTELGRITRIPALADAIGAGGAMDKDTAYVEAVGSARALASLQFLGLPIPQDRLGGVLRYQTDHDEVGRATSCGPRTSRLMVQVLAREAIRLEIPIFNQTTAVRILVHDGPERRTAGVLALVAVVKWIDSPLAAKNSSEGRGSPNSSRQSTGSFVVAGSGMAGGSVAGLAAVCLVYRGGVAAGGPSSSQRVKWGRVLFLSSLLET